MGHRFMAGILFIWTIALFIKLIKRYRSNHVMYWGSIITISLITLQVFFGAMIIFTLLNLAVALMHALVISCYFGMLSYFLLLSSRSAKAEKVRLKKENNKYQQSAIKTL